MDKKTFCGTIAELMQKYDENRAKWISLHGNDNGFDKWFTDQIFNKTNKSK